MLLNKQSNKQNKNFGTYLSLKSVVDLNSCFKGFTQKYVILRIKPFYSKYLKYSKNTFKISIKQTSNNTLEILLILKQIFSVE
jgi:hypothetical protein